MVIFPLDFRDNCVHNSMFTSSMPGHISFPVDTLDVGEIIYKPVNAVSPLPTSCSLRTAV
jgi:hypothetical protein